MADKSDKIRLPKKVSETLRALYGIVDSRVSWAQLVIAMRALGYNDEGRSGTHIAFVRTDRCRWSNVGGAHLSLAKNHQGHQVGAAIGKSKDWGRRLKTQGITWELIQEHYQLSG